MYLRRFVLKVLPHAQAKFSPSKCFAPYSLKTNLEVVQDTDLKHQLSKLKVYTKTGDKGTSALYTGERRPKTDPIFEALGTTDELSSFIGLAHSFLKTPDAGNVSQRLIKIQCLLQDVGSNIATPPDSKSRTKIDKTRFDPDGHFLKELESWIDELSEHLVLHSHFILPSGGSASSALHVARTVCRRAERSVIYLDGSVDKSVNKYLNRLSDFLFVCARFVAKSENKTEDVYIKH
ncbi:hypothetical protein BB559_005710 [Furculomyces boomerangus]|uniref:Corrinoid adenosyltransferase MMAB n=2 Tax=Harpellales TaxID=61421 RepID=A0A2T9Y737_9FUNG|nr:hypothetical protein BB559_005743 [Furculomyces boomerangus]PVU88143.1 hypothetical protein BB559_005710 [Furculomyces boomerangus]PWA02060.1 hypothetical protein BB558_001799 [Smittium angustum]